jgi:hypothetical protein
MKKSSKSYHGFEIKTKEGKIIVKSRTPIPTFREAKLLGQLNLKDKRTPIGSTLNVFKANKKRSKKDNFENFFNI